MRATSSRGSNGFDIIVGADLEPDYAVHRFTLRGEEDGGQTTALNEMTTKRKAVLAGHHDVEQREVGAFLRQESTRLRRAFGLAHGEPLADEILRQGFTQAAFVVDEQDGSGRGVGHD